MPDSSSSINQVRDILKRMDRKISDVRERRLGGSPTPPPDATPQHEHQPQQHDDRQIGAADPAPEQEEAAQARPLRAKPLRRPDVPRDFR